MSGPKSTDPDPAAVRTITLIHNTALGDFVLAYHLVAAVRSLYPTAELHCITKSSHGRLGEHLGLIQKRWDIDTPEFLPLFRTSDEPATKPPAPLRDLDVVLNCTGPADGVVARNLAGCTDAVVFSIDPVAIPNDSRHITEQWRDQLARAGMDPGMIQPIRMEHGTADRFKARAKLQRHSPTAGEPIVLVHPGSGALDKCWSVEHFRNVVMTLKAESVQPIWIVGPVEQDRWPAERFDDLAALAPVVRGEDLTAAADLAAAADAYLGNDAGFSHVAALMGTPVVVVFGPTPASVWQPLGRNVRVLSGSGRPPNPFAGIDAKNVAGAVLAALADPPISA